MNVYTERLQDAILDNASVRRGLQDHEAQPLIDWGLKKAEVVTEGLDTLGESAAEERYEVLYGALPKLMTRIAWLAVYWKDKGPDWTQKTVRQINELSQALHGEEAPQITGDLAYNEYSRAELVQVLISNVSTTENEEDSNGEEEK